MKGCIKMSEGWKLREDGRNHYFVSGRSLCEIWMYTGESFDELRPGVEPCSKCSSISWKNHQERIDNETDITDKGVIARIFEIAKLRAEKYGFKWDKLAYSYVKEVEGVRVEFTAFSLGALDMKFIMEELKRRGVDER